FDNENIGIDKTRCRADVNACSKGGKINDHVFILSLERVKKRFCAVRSQHLASIWEIAVDCRQEIQIGGGIPSHCIGKVSLPGNHVEKSNPCLRSKCARDRRIANVSVHQNYTAPALRNEGCQAGS